MTALHGDKKITMRMSIKEWFALLGAVLAIAAPVYATYLKANSASEDLAQYKQTTDAKLDRLLEMVSVIKGKVEK